MPPGEPENRHRRGGGGDVIGRRRCCHRAVIWTCRCHPVQESPLAELLLGATADDIELPVRQVVDVAVEGTQTSCGYGVPVFEFVSQRVRAERGRRFKPKTAPARRA